MSAILENQVIVQIGIIVKNIEETSLIFSKMFGTEKPQWFWTDPFDKAKTEYRGNPTHARAKLAFIKLKNLEIELIEPDDKPSTWREHLDTEGEGIHHIAFVIDGMNKILLELAKIEIPLIQKGEYTGGRYAYIDSLKDLKVMIELLEHD
ncbi:MAG: VOC family protein [Candidatus Heimdallarchaeota archaeon]|nr:MAG: VOC family protein [Candidatus Heimdallarchaeota archaeon]